MGFNPPFEEGVATFQQPTISENGTIGGDSFAVFADYEVSTAWHAFDGNIGTRWRPGYVNHYIGFYNPKPLKVSQLVVDSTGAGGNEYATKYIFYASDDFINWTTLVESSNSALLMNVIVPSDKQEPYHYYKLHIKSVANSSQQCTINEIHIIGTVGGIGAYPMGTSTLMCIKY